MYIYGCVRVSFLKDSVCLSCISYFCQYMSSSVQKGWIDLSPVFLKDILFCACVVFVCIEASIGVFLCVLPLVLSWMLVCMCDCVCACACVQPLATIITMIFLSGEVSALPAVVSAPLLSHCNVLIYLLQQALSAFVVCLYHSFSISSVIDLPVCVAVVSVCIS